MLRTNLGIFKPQRFGNVPHAGGHRTPEMVQSGKLNDVFSSISDVDHARSAFDLVKLYPAVNTNDDSRLQDAHVFLSDQPDDPLVHTLIVEASELNDTSVLSDMLPMLSEQETKYHGTSALTAEAAASELSVAAVSRSMTPTIERRTTQAGIKPTSGERALYRTKRVKSFGEITKINIDVPDLFEGKPVFFAEYQSLAWVTVGADTSSGNIIAIKELKVATFTVEQSDLTYDGQAVSVDLTNPRREPVTEGQYFTLYYFSSEDFRFHSLSSNSTITLAAGERILPKYCRIKKDGDGAVYTDDGQGRFIGGGYIFATIDYATGAITANDGYTLDFNGTVAENLGVTILKAARTVNSKSFQLEDSSFARDSLYIRCETDAGAQLSASSDSAGNITGTNITGTVSATGFVELTFAVDVKPESISYDVDTIQVSTVPPPPDGFDTTKLPANGVVNIFHQHNLVAVQHRERTEKATFASGEKLTILAEANWVDIVDSNNASLYSPTDANYSYNKTTGELTINAGISDFAAPFVITAIQSELVQVDSISANTLHTLTPLSRTYPAGATVSSVYVLGDFQALTKDERTLSAWQNNFNDRGASASSAINTTQYPIACNNKGAINEKWAVVFTSSTAFNIIGENVGNIYSGDILNDAAPINTFAQAPYFIIPKEAFGGGLQAGEAFLFTTQGASKPIMVTRSVSPGHSSIEYDSSTLSFRGNVG